MTQQEAIAAMKQGKKVTHRYFSSDEWVTLQNGKLVTEDGCIHNWTMFWTIRSSEYWETDWSLFETKQPQLP